MKAIHSMFLAAALTAAGLAGVTDVQAARGGGGGGGGGHGGGGHGGASYHGGYGHGGHYHGGGSYWYGGGYYPYWGWGLYAPLAWSTWGYGYPYYAYDYYYPRAAYAYPQYAYPQHPQQYPEGVIESPPTTVVPRGEGAPAHAPAYMNFCESSGAYYPKISSCPEGWKFQPSR